MSFVVGSIARLPASMPPRTGSGQVHGAPLQFSAADNGAFRVAGTVVIDGTPPTPAVRRVRLFDKISGRLAREQWSAADGTFEFAKVRQGPWLLVVDDYTLTYEADAATEVLAVL